MAPPPARGALGWAAVDNSGVVSPFRFAVRETGAEDVTIKVLFCGICHTDLDQLRNEHGLTRYPVVPGHEIVGVATEVGEMVKKIKVGDRVGVSYLVGSCQKCDFCTRDMEQYCPKKIPTSNSAFYDGLPTYGGFANIIVTNHRFVLRLPDTLPLDAAAPLLCAGITVYSPLQRFGLTDANKRCGIVGLGGVGHMGVKFAKAYGQHVTVISTSQSKEQEAREILGADAFLVSRHKKQMKEARRSLDYILDTVPVAHPLEPLLSLLKTDGKLVLLGASPAPLQFTSPQLLFGRLTICGSLLGSIKEMQEMLDFCGEHGIIAMIEKINMEDVNKSLERLEKNRVRYRFVIDVGSSLQDESCLRLEGGLPSKL